MSTVHDCGPAPENLVLPRPTKVPESQALSVPTPMHLMQMAIEKGVDADTMGKLLDLHLRWEAEQQRKAYIEAMAIFRANPPEIKKTKKVEYENRDGSVTSYHHAELDKTVDVISEALAKVDIRPSWRTSDVGGKITVTCVLTHKDGHCEDVATLIRLKLFDGDSETHTRIVATMNSLRLNRKRT